MHASLPKYRDPGMGTDEPVPNLQLWATACDHFENRRYRDALVATLRHVNPDLLATQDATNPRVVLEAKHGSAQIEMRIENGRFSVKAPFLKMGEEHRVPLMRRVAEVNFQPLTLPSISLQDDVLSFEYETVLELCQPGKIMDVLHEVCIFADRYDDEFIKKYKAAFFREPDVTTLTEAESHAVLEHLVEIASEYRRYLAFFDEKHADRLQWDIISMTMLQIASMPTVHGTLRWELGERIQGMYDPEIEPAVRIDTGRRFLDDLCARIDRKEVISEFYHAKSFLSLKQHGSLPQLQQDCQQRRERFYTEMNDGNTYGAAFSLTHFFCRLVYHYNLQEDHRQLICETLERIGGKPTGEALRALKQVFDGFLDASPRYRKKGFFARFFG